MAYAGSELKYKDQKKKKIWGSTSETSHCGENRFQSYFSQVTKQINDQENGNINIKP